MISASSEGRSTRRRVLGRRAPLLALAAVLGTAWPAGSRALTLVPGQALEVVFGFSAAPLVGGSLPVDVLLVDPVVTPNGVSGWEVELWDGATHLGTNATGPTTQPWAFTSAASAWGTNAVDVDLTSVIDGSIDGRVRLVPQFSPGGVGATVEIGFFPPPGRGLTVGIGDTTGPTDQFAAASPLPQLQSEPSVVAVPEPGALLLAPLAVLWARRRLRR